jgi:hypothetical protein
VSLVETVREHVRQHRRGMLFDLVFAIAWVTVVSLLFEVVDGPQWAYYLCMGAGVAAYFGFVWSLDAAKEQSR